MLTPSAAASRKHLEGSFSSAARVALWLDGRCLRQYLRMSLQSSSFATVWRPNSELFGSHAYCVCLTWICVSRGRSSHNLIVSQATFPNDRFVRCSNGARISLFSATLREAVALPYCVMFSSHHRSASCAFKFHCTVLGIIVCRITSTVCWTEAHFIYAELSCWQLAVFILYLNVQVVDNVCTVSCFDVVTCAWRNMTFFVAETDAWK